jgi:GNAT superfamily N-acetyltransferase
VLTVRLHGHPRLTYPYFSGFKDEKGEDVGCGFNVNIPLPKGLDGERFPDALSKALTRISRSSPAYLSVPNAVGIKRSPLKMGAASGYSFLFAERGGDDICGYTCFGPAPCTADSFDLYWIVAAAACQGQGVGKRLLTRSEEIIHEVGGRRVYAETSARLQSQPTRAFYRHTGFRQVAWLKDFYAPRDDKIIYCKTLA